MAKRKTKEEGGAERGSWCSCLVLITSAIVLLLAGILFDFNHENVPVTDRGSTCSQERIKYLYDCCCDYEAMNRTNEEILRPMLKRMVEHTFFKYFKVNLRCSCPFLPDDGMCKDGKPEATVDRTIDAKDARAFKDWKEVENPWTHNDETNKATMTYINLQLNPQLYTGYTGPPARRIWDAIYLEICHKYPSEECQETGILYKLISGLHSSISIHIAATYLLDEKTNTRGQNLSLMYDRVLRHPERVKNLYFTFFFVLRSVSKAARYSQHEYDNSELFEDEHSGFFRLHQFRSSELLKDAFAKPFDVAKFWIDQCGAEFMQQAQIRFRNISALMGCIGCEKCRVWGKLQFLGLQTALKILLSQEPPIPRLQLRREMIALVNLLNQLSVSVNLVYGLAPSVKN